jgi:hypothetical protein
VAFELNPVREQLHTGGVHMLDGTPAWPGVGVGGQDGSQLKLRVPGGMAGHAAQGLVDQWFSRLPCPPRVLREEQCNQLHVGKTVLSHGMVNTLEQMPWRAVETGGQAGAGLPKR